MKISLFILLFSFNVFAEEVYSIQKSDLAAGKIQYALFEDKDGWRLIKNSNYFDSSNSIGKFKITNAAKIIKELNELKRLYQALARIESEIGEVETVQENSFAHQLFYHLGKFKIDKSHTYYNDIAKTFEKIQNKIKYKPLNAYEYMGRKKKHKIYINGKKQKYISNEKCVISDKLCIQDKFGVIFL